MDETPLIGEPGSFILSKTTATNNAETNVAGSSQPKSAIASTTTSGPPTPKIDTAVVAGKGNKGAGGEKSPTTAGVRVKKERRKSRGVGTGGVTTPK